MPLKQKLLILLKKCFRGLFYAFNEGKVVRISRPEIMKGLKWILSSSYGWAYSSGHYENGIVRALIHFLKKDSVFLDIGGHAGYMALLGSRIAGKVHTFEPDHMNYQFMNEIFALNKTENVYSYQLAVGREKGYTFFEKGSTSSMGRVASGGSTKVNLTSIDDFVVDNHISRIDLIKIDVEGFGAEVIKGMRESIREFKPIIFYEIHNDEELSELKWLASMSYKFYKTDLTPASLNRLEDQFVIAVP